MNNTMMAALTTQAAEMPENLAGNLGIAGAGAVLLWGSWYMARKDGGRWIWNSESKTGQYLGSKDFDWISLISWACGFLGVSALLMDPSPIGSFLRWVQGLIVTAGESSWLAAFGAGFFCFMCFVMAMCNRDDSMKDMRYGYIAAILFPLGGGIFGFLSDSAAEIMTNILESGAVA